jgi:hypothetical protein
METPHCFRCGRELSNWEGNLMVDMPAWEKEPAQVLWLRPYCPECIQQMDARENGKETLHHIWGVHNVRDNPLLYLGEVLKDIVDPDPKYTARWHPQAITDLVELVILALPDKDAVDLLQGFSDWNLETDQGQRLTDRVNGVIRD